MDAPDWTRSFWIEAPWLLVEARRREAKGEGSVAFGDTDGPARWLPFPPSERRNRDALP